MRSRCTLQTRPQRSQLAAKIYELHINNLHLDTKLSFAVRIVRTYTSLNFQLLIYANLALFLWPSRSHTHYKARGERGERQAASSRRI